MIASTQITYTEIFAFVSVLVLKLLSRKVLFTNRKRQQKLFNSRLLFEKIANFRGQLLQNYNHWSITSKSYMIGMRNFQDTFETCKRSIICAFYICITVPLIFLSFVVLFLVDMFNEKAPFLTRKKTSVVKSETHFCREAVEN